MADFSHLAARTHEPISTDCQEAEDEIRNLNIRIDQLRDALKWYASERNYNDDHAPGEAGYFVEWTFDLGHRAQEALTQDDSGVIG